MAGHKVVVQRSAGNGPDRPVLRLLLLLLVLDGLVNRLASNLVTFESSPYGSMAYPNIEISSCTCVLNLTSVVVKS